MNFKKSNICENYYSEKEKSWYGGSHPLSQNFQSQRPRQEFQAYEVTLGYTVNPGPVWATWDLANAAGFPDALQSWGGGAQTEHHFPWGLTAL